MELKVPKYAINSNELFHYLCWHISESEEYSDVTFQEVIRCAKIFKYDWAKFNHYSGKTVGEEYKGYLKKIKERLYEYLKNTLNIKVEDDKTIITINYILSSYDIDGKLYLKDVDFEDAIYSTVLNNIETIAVQLIFKVQKNDNKIFNIFTFEEKEVEYNNSRCFTTGEYIGCILKSKQEVYKNNKEISLTRIESGRSLPRNEFKGQFNNLIINDDDFEIENIIIDEKSNKAKYTFKTIPFKTFDNKEIPMNFECFTPTKYDKEIIYGDDPMDFYYDEFEDVDYELIPNELRYLDSCSVLYKFSTERMMRKFEDFVDDEKERRYMRTLKKKKDFRY